MLISIDFDFSYFLFLNPTWTLNVQVGFVHYRITFISIISWIFCESSRFYVDNFFGRTGALRAVSGRVYLPLP